jgi:citrate/tricarballylate utilization protein
VPDHNTAGHGETKPGKLTLAILQDGERAMRICNACRYCEGFCAVFPAMERRIEFGERDLLYLANLCHDCGECYYSCQYAPPHEFALHFPHTLAEIRRQTYREYAWPGAFKGLFRRNGLALALGALLAPLVFLIALYASAGPQTFFSAHSDADGAFHAVLGHGPMIAVFSLLGLGVAGAFGIGLVRFWRDLDEPLSTLFDLRAVRQALADAATLRYLDGGGDGCAYPSEVPATSRRTFHHLTFYGFMLCFSATTVAAIYHNVFGWYAPYPLLSLPVLLGIAGGAGLLIGPLGLLRLKLIRDPETQDTRQSGMDTAFLAMLFLTSLTGFLLLGLRETAAMGTVLAVHLGIVAGLFITMPYGKFVHAFYRTAALVMNALEKRRPVKLPGGEI